MIRSNFLAAFLALGFTSFSLPSHAAPVDPDIYFYPATEWSTSSDPVNMAGLVVRECKIGTVFNNGFSMQFAGSHKGVKQMNIDFFQDAFEIGKHYNVSLSVPGKSTKVFNGKAQDSHLLSLGLEGQNEFYSAIKSSSVFDLQIDSNVFRFYMVGFAHQSKAFDDCMAGNYIKKKKPSGVVATVASAHASEAQDVLLNEAIAYEESERTGVPITEILPEDHPANIKPSSSSSEGSGVLKSEVHSAMNTPFEQTQPQQRQRLSERLAEQLGQSPEISNGEAASLEAQQGSLKIPPGLKTRDEPVSPIPAPPEKNVEVVVIPVEPAPVVKPSSTEEVLDRATDSIVMAEMVEPPPSPVVPSFKRPEVKITKETERLEADFTKRATVSPVVQPSADPALMSKISELQEQLQKLEQENKALNEELETAIDESREEKVSISSENWNLEKAARRYNEAELQLKKLGQQLQQERTACSVEKQELEMMLFDPKLTEQAQIARLSALQTELNETKKMLHALQAATN